MDDFSPNSLQSKLGFGSNGENHQSSANKNTHPTNMKTILFKKMLAMTAFTAGVVWLIAGCSSTAGYKKADKAGLDVVQFREKVVLAQTAADDTLKALDQVASTAGTDPRPAFEKYASEVKYLESTDTVVKRSAHATSAQAESYFNHWEQQLAGMNNPEIRALSEQRKLKLQQQFDGLMKTMDSFQTQFDPWLSDLKDLQKYLGTDLTASSVGAARAMFSKVTRTGADVQSTMKALVSELDSFASAITAAKEPATK